MIFRSDFIAAESRPQVRTVDARPSGAGSSRFVAVLIGSIALHGVVFAVFGELDAPATAASAPTWVSFETTIEPVAEPEPDPIVEPEPPPPPEPVARPVPVERVQPAIAPAEPTDSTPPVDAQPSSGIASHEGGMAVDLPAGGGSPGAPIAHVPVAAPAAPARSPAAAPAPPSRPQIDLRAIVRGWVGEVGQILARRASDRYPLAARRAGLEGLVLLSIVVDERGRVLDATVRRSSGHSALDQAALAMVGEVGEVPAPPSQLSWEPRPLTVPVAYRLR